MHFSSLRAFAASPATRILDYFKLVLEYSGICLFFIAILTEIYGGEILERAKSNETNSTNFFISL